MQNPKNPKNKKVSKLKAMAKPIMMGRNTKVPSKLNVKAPSKEEVDLKVARIKDLGKNAEDLRVGEQEFGSDYRNLGLKYKNKGHIVTMKDGNLVPKLKKDGGLDVRYRFTSSKDDNEEVYPESGKLVSTIKKTNPYTKEVTSERIVESPAQRKERVLGIKTPETLKNEKILADYTASRKVNVDAYTGRPFPNKNK